jgi:hypothetical protein
MRNKETLEEFAEKVSRAFDNDNYKALMDLVIDGAKWEQEQDKNKYSEEDLKLAYSNGQVSIINKSYTRTEEWFEQFKKK